MDVQITDLIVPIFLSGVAVFFLSFVMWMVMPHHRSDWGALPDEDGTMSQLGDIKQGQYMFPHCKDSAQMKDPEWLKKSEDGPSGLVIIRARGPMNMGKYMGISFLFNVIVSAIVAYVATIALQKGDEGMDVLRLTGTVAFLAYSGALAWNAIWFHHSWGSTAKSMFDGLIYGVGTGVIFMLMWPAA